jgi:hypothetical protein
MPHYKKRRKRINKKTILLYSGIILVCFLLGGTISFVATRVSTFLQQETKSSPPIEAEQGLGMQLLESAGPGEIEKTYLKKMDYSLRTDASEQAGDN